MIKVIKPLLVTALVFLFTSGGIAHAQIFSGFENGGAPYGLCLESPDDPACTADGVKCDDPAWQKDQRCISQAEAGTTQAKNSLGGAGITHTENFGDLIIKYVNFALPYLALAAFVGFVVAGFFYVTAYGNDQQIEKAKKILIWSVVGLIVVIMSYTVVQFFTSGLLGKLQ
jgi:hypothetical protein